MFSINDGWGNSDAQDILVSKLFTKPQIKKEKKKKGKKNNKNITDEAEVIANVHIHENEDKNTKENQRKKRKRKIETNADDIEKDTDDLDCGDKNAEETLPKKKKNSKTKNPTTTKKETDNNIEETNTETILSPVNGDEQTPKKKKKKRNKSKKISTTNTNENGSDNGDDNTIQQDTDETNENNKNDMDTNTNGTESKEQENLTSTDDAPKKQTNAMSKRISSFQKKMNRKLEGGHFRYINEKLYTKESSVAVDMFKRQPSLFEVYHKGFESQVEHWPQNPVDLIIEYIKEK